MRAIAAILAVGLLSSAVIGCGPTGPQLPDLDHDLSAMGLVPTSAAAPPRITPEQVIASVQADNPEGSIRPIRLGHRWSARHSASAWVLVYRAPGSQSWGARVVNDRSGEVLFTFDEGSLRSFGVALPDW
jgi:hypothetical protein